MSQFGNQVELQLYEVRGIERDIIQFHLGDEGQDDHPLVQYGNTIRFLGKIIREFSLMYEE